MKLNERVLGAILTLLGAADVLEDAGIDVTDVIGAERDAALGPFVDELDDGVFDHDANLDVAKRVLIEALDTILAEQTAAETSETSETEVASE